jgi:hypothetical protein
VKFGINITGFERTYGLHLQGMRVNRDGRITVKCGCKCKEMVPQVMQCLRVGTRGGRGKVGGPNPSRVWEEETIERKRGNVEEKSETVSHVSTIFRDGTVATSHCNNSSLLCKYDRISGSDTSVRALPILFNFIILRL